MYNYHVEFKKFHSKVYEWNESGIQPKKKRRIQMRQLLKKFWVVRKI